jgi:hypothetical protein
MKRLCTLVTGLVVLLGATQAQDLGRIDTIGGTTHEWQTNGHGARRLVNMPGQGIYVVWMYSTSTSTAYPDRNMRLNYYDFATRDWSWIDPDFMQSGVNMFPVRAGYGSLAALADGSETYASAHVGSPTLTPAIAGLGPDSMRPGPAGYSYPVIAAGTDSTIHVAMYGYPNNDTVYYCRAWDSVKALGMCGYPTHNIAASKTSGDVIVTWVDAGGSSPPYWAYYRRSSDGGRTWGPVTLIDPPPAFGPDSVVSFSPYGVFPYFGSDDRLHIMVSVFPVISGTYHPEVAELWHLCPDNSPYWSEVHRVSCDSAHLLGGFGYNALFCDRPSLGEDDDGNLYVAWEQFDSSNVEPATGLLRAGIWLTLSSDRGYTWQPGRLITARTTASYRYPCIVDRQVECGSGPDTVVITYESDAVAGFWMFGVGPCTFNPMICHFWTTGDTALVGVGSTPEPGFRAHPATLVRGVLVLPGDRTQNTGHRAELLDATGREVMALCPGANDVSRLSPGVYFLRRSAERELQRVVIVR